MQHHKINLIAQICHEANRAYCQSIGDDTQKPWEDAPEWQKESTRQGVLFHVHRPDALASASHDEWMRHKLMTGWEYGIKKDEEAKTHPCLVPFHDLPPEQQRKDALFRNTVHAALKALDA